MFQHIYIIRHGKGWKRDATFLNPMLIFSTVTFEAYLHCAIEVRSPNSQTGAPEIFFVSPRECDYCYLGEV